VRDITLSSLINTFHLKETLDLKKVNLDYATLPLNIPVLKVTVKPDINSFKRLKHLFNTGNNVLISFIYNRDYPDIIIKAEKEPLAFNDEEELIKLMRKIIKEIRKGIRKDIRKEIRKLKKRIRKLKKEIIIELMR